MRETVKVELNEPTTLEADARTVSEALHSEYGFQVYSKAGNVLVDVDDAGDAVESVRTRLEAAGIGCFAYEYQSDERAADDLIAQVKQTNSVGGSQDIPFDQKLDDFTPSNDENANAALKAIESTTDYNAESDDDIETYAADLLTNVMHLCRREGIDFDDVLRRGRSHHEAERRGE